MIPHATIHFITNGVFSTSIAGGDIHFLKLAQGAAQAGYNLHFFGGHALQEVITQHHLPGQVTLTDQSTLPKINTSALSGQFALLRDMYGRYHQTLRALPSIQPDDFAYAVSDYWFDVLPAVRCPARRKLMVLHMDAPRLGQIIRRSRPDVDPARLASLHYWASQEYSLRRLARCPQKHFLHLHPDMKPRLERLGVHSREMTHVSYGLDLPPVDAVPAPARRAYDVVWIGRVHRQKGIDDLIQALAFLRRQWTDFRAVLIGNVREALQPRLQAAGLADCVEFSGFVSEEEKILLFKSSRLFLMPSKHEGSPRVIGESLVCGTPVVAYDIPNYRPVFGDFVRYVPPFDLAALQESARREIEKMRRGDNYLDHLDLKLFRQENAWPTVQRKFLEALQSFDFPPPA